MIALRMVLLCVALLLPLAAQAQQATAWTQIDAWRAEGRFEQVLTALDAMAGREGVSPAAVHWRRARTLVDLGEQADDADRQRSLYERAETEARAAVEADPDLADAYLALAIATGRVALVSGNREKVERSRAVKENVDQALRLDPEHDAAYHVRGRWHYEIADLGFFARNLVKIVYGGLPDASFEQAAADFERAMAVRDRIGHRVELGKAYHKLGRRADARRVLQEALAMSPADPDDAGYQREARTLLEKL